MSVSNPSAVAAGYVRGRHRRKRDFSSAWKRNCDATPSPWSEPRSFERSPDLAVRRRRAQGSRISRGNQGRHGSSPRLLEDLWRGILHRTSGSCQRNAADLRDKRNGTRQSFTFVAVFASVRVPSGTGHILAVFASRSKTSQPEPKRPINSQWRAKSENRMYDTAPPFAASTDGRVNWARTSLSR